jgi:hypothetical protein
MSLPAFVVEALAVHLAAHPTEDLTAKDFPGDDHLTEALE